MNATTRNGIGMTSARTRDRLIERLKAEGVRNPAVLERVRAVPRHLFVDEALASRAYEDTALPIGFGQTISQPYIVAAMTEALIEGDKKREAGLNLEGRLGGGRLFAQYVDQDIAKLPRRGYEAEVAWRFTLPGLFLVGESPVGNWIQPAVRVSHIDNRFVTPDVFPAPSFGWDWTKWDIGVRMGLVRDVDLTAEYARNNATRADGSKVHPDEFLVTLRAGF